MLKAEERDRAILESRALELAKPLEENGLEGGTEVVVFHLCGERYAVESAVVREIRRLDGVTSLPGVPDFVMGIMNVRGEILPVLDLGTLLGLPSVPFDEEARVVVLSGAGMTFGIAAHGLKGTERLSLQGLQAAPVSGNGLAQGVVRGVTSDRLIVLDGKALLTDKGLVVGAA
ncbi:MAG: chemotaxis protein CheW [Desulfosoma sp.]